MKQERKEELFRRNPVPRKTHIGQFVKSWEERQNKSDRLARVIALDPVRWELIDFQFTAEHVAHQVGMNAHQYDIVHVSLPDARMTNNK